MKHKCLGVFLAFLFVLLFIISFTLYNLKTTLGNPNFYTKELLKSNFYSLAEQNIPKIFEQNLQGMGGSQELAAAAKDTFKADWLKNQNEKNITNFLRWFYVRTQNLEITLSFSEFKDNYFKEVEIKYDTLPVCTSKNISENPIELTCRQKGVTFLQFKENIIKEINQTPDAKVFLDDFTFNAPLSPFLLSGPGNIINWVFYISTGLIFLILVLIIIMSRNSLRSLFRWVGIPLIIPSFLLLSFSIVGRFLIQFIPSISSFTHSGYPFSPVDYSTGISQLLDSLIRNIFLDLANRKLIETILIFGLALVLIIVSFFFKKKDEIIIPKT